MLCFGQSLLGNVQFFDSIGQQLPAGPKHPISASGLPAVLSEMINRDLSLSGDSFF